MTKKDFFIEDMPAILWGETSSRLCIAIHGAMSHKADDVIAILAEEAIRAGYQVMSFDLPEHGQRVGQAYVCNVPNSVHDIGVVMRYAQTLTHDIAVFGCSLGAYFSLQALAKSEVQRYLFLSPVVDMERVIAGMMEAFEVSATRLRAEKKIVLPIGQTLEWEYYRYVKEHPVSVWSKSTAILHGEADGVSDVDTVKDFAARHGCALEIVPDGEHYFHTPEQMEIFRQWLRNRFAANGVNI